MRQVLAPLARCSVSKAFNKSKVLPSTLPKDLKQALAQINIAYQLETIIAKSNVDRLSAHYSKWDKYVNTLSV